jgi:hypothetical protein
VVWSIETLDTEHTLLQDAGIQAVLEREGRSMHALLLCWQGAPWVIILVQPQPALLMLADQYQAILQLHVKLM